MEKENQIAKKLSSLSGVESKELLKSLIHDALIEEPKNTLTVKEKIARLKECKELLEVEYNFKKGDIVKWKPNLQNRGLPEYDEPVIVLDLLDSPLYDEEEGPSSTYFKEPLDIVLGYIAEDGELISFYFDKRRFQPFKTK